MGCKDIGIRKSEIWDSIPLNSFSHNNWYLYLELVDCGYNTDTCINNIDSYTCTCKPGYGSWSKSYGCYDINECNIGTNINTKKVIVSPINGPCSGSISCGANTVSCYNTPGAYYCSCKTGFENWKVSAGCTDKDECLTGILQINLKYFNFIELFKL